MKRTFTLLFASLFLCVGVINAQSYFKTGARTTTLEAGKQYFISVATYYGSACTNLLYDNGGTLAKSELLPNVIINDAAYLFTVEEVGEGCLAYIKNSNGKYLQANDLVSAEAKTGVYVFPYFDAKAVCAGNDVDACDENGNKIAYADITAETPIVTVQKNADNTNADNRSGWRYIYGLQAGDNLWCTPFAFYEVVEVDAATIEGVRNSLRSAVQDAQSLLTTAEFSATGGENIALQTTDPTGAGYISCANLDPTEGNNMEFLIDGKNDTYIHTNWHSIAASKDYFDVYLGEGKGLSEFQFSEVTRSGASNDFPVSIEIQGSTNGDAYTPVATVSGLPAIAGVSYRSPVVECDPSYIYLRFIVTGSNYAADRPYWHMAEFRILTPLVLSAKTEYMGKDKVLYALNLAVAEAEAIVDGEDISAIENAKVTIETYMAELSKEYPFTLTTDNENPVLYAIKSGRGDGYWYTYDATDSKISLAQYVSSNEQLWFFKEVSTDDYKCALQLYPYADASKAMSYQNTNNDPAKIVAQPLGTEGWTNLWLLAATDGEAPYGLQTYNKANYLSNNGGAANKMGMWNAAPGEDAGTAMYIYTVGEALQVFIDEAEAFVDRTAGTTVGYVVMSAEDKAAVESAIAAGEKAIEDKVGYAEAVAGMLDAMNKASVTTIQPETGKFYTIESAMNESDNRSGQMMYVNKDSLMQFRPEHNDSAVFQFVAAGEGQYYLYNVKTQTYLSTANAHGEGQAAAKAKTTETAKPVVITNMGRSNVVKIVPDGGAMLHAQASGSQVVAWDNESNTEASAWIIVETTYTPTGIETITTNAETVIYDLSGRRVAKMEKGIYIVNGKKVIK